MSRDQSRALQAGLVTHGCNDPEQEPRQFQRVTARYSCGGEHAYPIVLSAQPNDPLTMRAWRAQIWQRLLLLMLTS